MTHQMTLTLLLMSAVVGCGAQRFKASIQSDHGKRPSIERAEKWQHLTYDGHSYVLYQYLGQTSLCHDPDCVCSSAGAVARGSNQSTGETLNDVDNTVHAEFASARRPDFEEGIESDADYRPVELTDQGKIAEFYDSTSKTWVNLEFVRGLMFHDRIAYYVASAPGADDRRVFEKARIARTTATKLSGRPASPK